MKSRIVYTPAGASKKRRGRKVFFYAAIGTVILVVPASTVLIARMPSLQISKIALSGAHTLDERVVRERIGTHLAGTRALILPENFFFFVNTGAIASDLESTFARIEHATAVKNFPDMLDVAITERTFWGVFCNGSQGSSTPVCGYIDSAGVVYERAPESKGQLIVVIRSDTEDTAIIPRQAVDPGAMAHIRALAEKLPTETGITVASFDLRSRVPSEIRATAGEGFTLIFKREDDIRAMAHVLKRVLNEEIKDKRSRLDYIDLRFGNKVFYKLR